MEMINLKSLDHYINDEKVKKSKKKNKITLDIEVTKQGFEGKKFQNLNDAEKDELLKIIAMQLGIIEE